MVGGGFCAKVTNMTRIAVLSDIHISKTHPFFYHNWDICREAVEALAPDLVIVEGDITLDGAETGEQIAFARAEIARLTPPTLVIAGNHDMGYPYGTPNVRQAATVARHNLWLAQYPQDCWAYDVGGWRHIGINTMGFGGPDEARLWAEIEAAFAGFDGPIALHSHLAMCQFDLTGEAPYKGTIPPAARDRLLALGGTRLKTVVSGHFHLWREREIGGINHIWCPSTAMRNSDERANALQARPEAGFLLLTTLPDGSMQSELIAPRGLMLTDIRHWDGSYYEIVREPYRLPV